MNPATLETPKADAEAVRNRVIDATRHAAHISHQAKLLKSLAVDALEDGKYAAKRALKSVQRGVHQLEDMKDEAIHQVKRQPAKAVGIAAAGGLVVGVLVGFIGGRFSRKPAAITPRALK